MAFRDSIRQGLNLFFSIVQFLVTLLPYFGIGTGIGDRGMQVRPLIQPVFYFFFIWFLIYAACIAYGVYQALPAQRESQVLRRMGFFTASAFAGVTAYALVAQFGGSDWLLIAIFVWIIASLLPAVVRVSDDRRLLLPREEYLVLAPASLLAGWASLAILVNLAAVVKDAGTVPEEVPETVFSVVLLLFAFLIAWAVLHRTGGNVWYALPVVWGLAGVVIANTGQQPGPVVAAAAGLAALGVLAVLVQERWPARFVTQDR